MAELATLADR